MTAKLTIINPQPIEINMLFLPGAYSLPQLSNSLVTVIFGFFSGGSFRLERMAQNKGTMQALLLNKRSSGILAVAVDWERGRFCGKVGAE